MKCLDRLIKVFSIIEDEDHTVRNENSISVQDDVLDRYKEIIYNATYLRSNILKVNADNIYFVYKWYEDDAYSDFLVHISNADFGVKLKVLKVNSTVALEGGAVSV